MRQLYVVELRNDILDRAVSSAITATICPQSPLVSKRFRRRVAQAIGDDDESVSSPSRRR
jgi:hypothetical protein